MSLSAHGRDRSLVRVFKNTLFFVDPCLLFGIENISQIIRHLLSLVLGKDGDVALTQCASDNPFGSYG